MDPFGMARDVQKRLGDRDNHVRIVYTVGECLDEEGKDVIAETDPAADRRAVKRGEDPERAELDVVVGVGKQLVDKQKGAMADRLTDGQVALREEMRETENCEGLVANVVALGRHIEEEFDDVAFPGE
jgi:hypothetical protein